MPKMPKNFRLGRRGALRLNVRNAPQPVKQWLAPKGGGDPPDPVETFRILGSGGKRILARGANHFIKHGEYNG